MRFPPDGSYRARWIVPVSSAPLQGGYVRFEAGRLTYLGTTPPRGPVRDAGDVALLPGLVNAHTHLEFSDLSQPIGRSSMAFPDWAEAVVRMRMAAASGKTGDRSEPSPETARLEALRRGLQESDRAGVTLIGEIATAPWPIDQLASLRESLGPIQLVLFAEVLGLSPARQEQTWAWATSLQTSSVAGLTLGLSPHAPYSTPGELVRRAVAHARTQRLAVAMHVAESREELQLLATGEGPLRSSLERLQVWRAGLFPSAGGIDAILRDLAGGPQVLVVHGNYLSSAQIEFLAGQPQMSVVYCPRTHAYFGHDRHPIAELWHAGVRVALGTDSRASNPDLSVWHEARFLRSARPDLAPQRLLRAVTADAADALGHEHFGRLAVGLSPGMVAVSSTAADEHQLFETLFEGEPQEASTPFLS